MSVVGSVFEKPLDDDVYGLQNALAIIVSGDTAPSALSQGKYIYLINHSTIRSGLYKIISAISSGDTIVSTDIETVPDGIINDLIEADYALNSKMPTSNAFDEILIPTGSDLNDYKTSGTYIIPNDSAASQISNMPLPASGRLIVMNRTTSSYMVQEYYPTTVDPKKYVRNYNNGTWTNWDQIANSTETGTWTLSLSRAVVSVVSGSNNYVRIGNMVQLECRFSVTSSESGTAYIASGIPTFNKTRTTVVGSWYDNNTDASGQLVSYGNGTVWFTQAGAPHALTNHVGHNISISLVYGLY